jgi:hypothetical protein
MFFLGSRFFLSVNDSTFPLEIVKKKRQRQVVSDPALVSLVQRNPPGLLNPFFTFPQVILQALAKVLFFSTDGIKGEILTTERWHGADCYRKKKEQ